MRILSALEMSAIDRNAQDLGIEPIVLMENAGRQVASEIQKKRRPSSVVILCGPGNNGGDGFVVARHLGNAGWKVSIVEMSEPVKPEASRNRDIASSIAAIDFKSISDSSQVSDAGFLEWLGQHDVIVDALLGTGAKGRLREPIASLVAATADLKVFKVAVDVPSGLDADTGKHEGEVFKSDLTVTFHSAKAGHLEGKAIVGELVVADIGIPKEAETLAGPGDLLFVRDRRKANSHKGENGILLIVGGSKDYHGAPAISGIAAMRTGIDLAYIAVPEAINEVVAKHSPSLICRPYAGDHLVHDSLSTILDLADKSDAVCIGPGLGREDETLETVRDLIESLGNKPLVVDADGLKAYAGEVDRLGDSVVITPHGGEFEILTGVDLPSESLERRNVVLEWSSITHCTWTVKGRQDIIARGKRFKVNVTGTSCMTVGGTGDCLTGIIGGLMARGNDPFRSATAGCFIAGKAGEFASNKMGCHLLPTDIAEEVPDVFQEYG